VLNLNLWRLESATPATNLTRRRFEGAGPSTRTRSSRIGAGGADATNYTDMIIEDGSYLRLSAVTLGFRLPTAGCRAAASPRPVVRDGQQSPRLPTTPGSAPVSASASAT
jgi:hypothetical protein